MKKSFVNQGERLISDLINVNNIPDKVVDKIENYLKLIRRE
jgi:hypothetical protein